MSDMIEWSETLEHEVTRCRDVESQVEIRPSEEDVGGVGLERNDGVAESTDRIESGVSPSTVVDQQSVGCPMRRCLSGLHDFVVTKGLREPVSLEHGLDGAFESGLVQAHVPTAE